MKRVRMLGMGIGLGLVVLGGCQTYIPQAGLTLPTGTYLKHQPQYIPPSPNYPLSKELGNLEEAAARQPEVPPRPLGP